MKREEALSLLEAEGLTHYSFFKGKGEPGDTVIRFIYGKYLVGQNDADGHPIRRFTKIYKTESEALSDFTGRMMSKPSK